MATGIAICNVMQFIAITLKLPINSSYSAITTVKRKSITITKTIMITITLSIK